MRTEDIFGNKDFEIVETPKQKEVQKIVPKQRAKKKIKTKKDIKLLISLILLLVGINLLFLLFFF